MSDPLHAVLWNCGGFSQDKWNWLTSIDDVTTPSLFFLTEVHLYTKVNMRQGWTYISNPGLNSGVGVIYNNNMISLDIEWKSPDNRCMFISVTKPIKRKILLMYHPSGGTYSDKINFINRYSKYMKSSDIVLGDFNWHFNKSNNVNDVFADALLGKTDIVSPFVRVNESFPTYQNKVKGSLSRIDRVFADDVSECSFISNYNFPSGKSNHCPILFQVGKCERKRKWRMNSSMWQNVNNQSALRESFPLPSDDEMAYNLYDSYKARMIKHIQAEEKKINKKSKKLIYQAKAMINKVSKNSYLYRKYKSIIRKVSEEREEKIRLLCNKKWDVTQDMPSQMLSRLLKKKDKKDSIDEIKHPLNGKYTKEPDDVVDGFYCFYKDLYSSSKVDLDILQEFLDEWKVEELTRREANDLSKSFSMNELEWALKSMKNFKAPGVDGLPSMPYKFCNGAGKNLLLRRFNSFLNGDAIPSDWKVGCITTIHKGGDKREIGNRRPITLLQSDYKILSKMVVNRLNRVMKKWIHRDQIGFMKDRIIYDNVLCAHEVLSQDEKYCVSVDFKKAYDSVSHASLLKTLEFLGLPERLKILIGNMISGSSAQVLVNGTLSDSFDIGRGVKQGDPLSPLLFDIAIEPLAAYIRSKCKGIKLGNTNYTIFLYADDIFIVAQDEQELIEYMNILDKWHMASGLAINKSKSFYFCHKPLEIDLPVCPKNGIKYLGFFMNKDGIIWTHTKHVFKRIQNSLNEWRYISNRILTKASILSGYVLSQMWYYSFILDFDEYIKEINKMCKKFLWCGSYKGEMYKTRTKMRAERTNLPLKMGGLGLFNLDVRFKAQRCWIADFAFNKDSKIGTIWKELYGLEDSNSVPSIDTPEHVLNFFYAYQETMRNNMYDPEVGEKMNSSASDGNLEFIDMDAKISSGDYIPVEVLEENIKNFKDKRKKKKQGVKVDLKMWTLRVQGEQEQILTPRQEVYKEHLKIDLLFLFRKIKKYVKNVRAINILWHYINGVTYFDRSKPCSKCGETMSHEHLFFDCPTIKYMMEHALSQFFLHDVEWSQDYFWFWMRHSTDEVEINIFIGAFISAIAMRYIVFRKNLLLDNLEDLMLSKWYCTLFDTNIHRMKISPTELFKTKWAKYVTFKDDIPRFRAFSEIKNSFKKKKTNSNSGDNNFIVDPYLNNQLLYQAVQVLKKKGKNKDPQPSTKDAAMKLKTTL